MVLCGKESQQPEMRLGGQEVGCDGWIRFKLTTARAAWSSSVHPSLA